MQHEEPMRTAVIVGAGLSGLAAAIALLEKTKVTDFEILEASDDVGGTWHFNHYPGLAVDIPAFMYQLKGDLNPNWSRAFAAGNEIWDYCKSVVDRRGLRSKIRFNTRVTEARFDDNNHLWRLQLDDGSTLTTRYLINATGGLTKPRLPDIPGVETFAGRTIHTAQWDDDLDLTGKRVAIIGTGATAVQLVPTIAGDVAHLDVYQRTPIWVLPKVDFELGRMGALLRLMPWTQRLLRWLVISVMEPFTWAIAYYRRFPFLTDGAEKLARWNLERQVRDPELRAKLTPQYRLGCKRPTMSNDYFRTFTNANVDLITEPIQEITPEGIRTRDGVTHEMDVLILATGYWAFDPENEPYPIIGTSGTSVYDFWTNNRYQAYQGTTIPGFPNMFLTFGPYLVPAGSILIGSELAAQHATCIINECERRGTTKVEVLQAVHDAHFKDTLHRQEGTLFFNSACGGANSYYFDRHGDAPLLRPGGTLAAMWSLRQSGADGYQYSALTNQSAPLAAT